MNILVLAPHPFYQERGTPIAVDLLVKTLTERGENVDLLTFHEGIDRDYDRLSIIRIKPFPSISGLRPGYSAKKLYCDVFMFFRFIILMMSKKYDVVHAVEESAFMAMLICPLRSTPFIFDIDSSMTTQLVDSYRFLQPFRKVLNFIESLPMRSAAAVAPMCESLADEVRKYRKGNVAVIKDVSLVQDNYDHEAGIDIRKDLSISGKMVMYIGNLEAYQGIDLLLESFADVVKHENSVSLIIIGGQESDIKKYREQAEQLCIADHVYFLGPRPVHMIGQYLRQADVLVSPRIHGTNTPMKIYSYLDSGVATLATRLPTHTQIINDDIAMLALPEKMPFSIAMRNLLENEDMRTQLASSAREYIRKEHSLAAFRKQVYRLYDMLDG